MNPARRILIVEDLATDAELAAREVRKVLPDGVFRFADTEGAFLAALSDFHPDLILSDYSMPRFDGMSALLLARERAPDTPFIVLTGSTNEETAVGCMKAGAWDYVIKEHIRRLGPAVMSALEQQRMRQERRIAEEAFRESETLFRKLFEEHAAIKMILDPVTGAIMDANEAAAMFYGWSREHLKQMRIQDINTLTPEEVSQEIQKVLSRKRVHFEFRHRRADGSIRDVEVFSSRIEVRGKSLLHSIVHDITDRKQAEAEKERLMTAVEQAGEIIFVTDPEGVIQYANPAFAEVTGYSREEVLGTNPRLLKSGVQDEAFYRGLWETITSGRTWRGRLVNRKKDGSFFAEEATISPVRGEQGVVTHFIAVKMDMTSVLALENEKERLQAQMVQTQKMESMGRLAGGVAHDFNNMLGVILGRIDLALQRIDSAHPLFDDLGEIRNAAERSRDMTRQLLAFARKQAISPRVLDLNEKVEGMLNMLRGLIGEEVQLVWEPGAGLWPVSIDPSQLDQLVMNLVVNAREAMNGAGRIVVETANATVRAEDCGGRSGCVPGEYVSLRVRDSGCGMDGESLAHIFEPFFTTKEGDRGTGLGLSTLYGIVKQNQGYIDVQSVPGAGTTFTIYLRRHAGPAEAVREAREEKVPPAPGQTVLVVEDEGALLELSRTLLSKAGYRILSASSPAEALRIAAEHPGPIHLLLTDVVMPGMSGSELTRRLKAQRPELTYLFTSGYPVADVVFPFELANEDRQRHFLEKPYTLQGLTDAILRLLDPGQADA